MEKDIRRHIVNLMKSGTGGCKHQEMTQALACPNCQSRMVKAQSEYHRLRKEYPEKFIRKPDDSLTLHEQNLSQKFGDRVLSDKLYREHMRLLAHGTPEEKRREMFREQNGFYERHTGDNPRSIIL